ncbi:MAG: LysR family transcriptional regulator [Selenomonadales bacterium]|nr:LysR family transcriptional regulator [Selenomonadales bacterium]MBQ5588407.1 LysR family transcriptional regulator [Selenomonadales bacterium]MBQ5636351.1 LysR family transcriptional regulator [Selenomonadales bacterium]
MDIRHLSCFVEVARQQSFTKAAQKLNVTQPSISKMIKTLEEELDVTLFYRSSKNAILTDAGKAVLRPAITILNSFNNLSVELSNVIHLKKGNLTVGIPPMVGVCFFSEIIYKFKERFPNINLKLIEVGSKQIERDIEEGSLDIGVISLPIRDKNISILPFVTEPMHLIVRKDHPLASLPVVNYHDLEKESFVMFRQDFSIRDPLIDRCRQSGFNPNIVCESSQWDFIAAMVAAKLGVAFLPATLSDRLSIYDVVSVPLEEPIVPWNLALIWHKEKYLSFAAQEFMKLVCEHFGLDVDLVE